MSGDNGFKHIEIQRENRERSYKFRSNPAAPKPPLRDFGQHGRKLEEEISSATNEIIRQRADIGIEADKLIVLSITENAMSPDRLELMIREFGLSLVEEIAEKEITRMLIQFPNIESINKFNMEMKLWKQDYKDKTTLTYAQRRDIFACIEDIRRLGREDKIGKKLSIIMVAGLPQGEIVVDIDVWHNGDRSTIIQTNK